MRKAVSNFLIVMLVGHKGKKKPFRLQKREFTVFWTLDWPQCTARSPPSVRSERRSNQWCSFFSAFVQGFVPANNKCKPLPNCIMHHSVYLLPQYGSVKSESIGISLVLPPMDMCVGFRSSCRTCGWVNVYNAIQYPGNDVILGVIMRTL